MQPLPHYTHDGDHGRVHVLQLHADQSVLFVTGKQFAADAAPHSHHRGRYYVIAPSTHEDPPAILVANAAPPALRRIDRDDAWHRRLELAKTLPPMLARASGVDSLDFQHRLPLRLLLLSYLEAWPPGATDEDVWRVVFRNSQRRLEARVAACLAGEAEYDARSYAGRGVAHPGYSHLDHFAAIYAPQIALVERLLDEHPHRRLTVVDLGTGCAHFLVTLARRLEGQGRLARVRLIGIDRARQDPRYADEHLPASPDLDVRFLVDDLTDPGFADRLRRLQPDVILANHVLEHLPGDTLDVVMNRYLHDWLLAPQLALSISVPLGDGPGASISAHLFEYSAESVAALARGMELRSAHAVVAEGIDATQHLGLCTWVRTPQVVRSGGFEPGGIVLQPEAVALEPDPILADFTPPFDPAEFAQLRRAPKIGEVRDRATFAGQRDPPRQVRQLLIKLPDGAVHLPRELAQFQEAIQIIVNHNRAANPNYDRAYAYANVFRGVTQFASYRGLSLNCHGDQLQSLRTDWAFPPDWSYIVSSTLPTILFEQAFDLSEALARFRAGETTNLYDTFNAQADPARAYRTENFGIYLLSPYVVHAAALAEVDVERVFMKVAFSLKRFFDNRELRRNPACDISGWYLHDTVGRFDGWLSHDHWNERFLKEDVCPDWAG